MRVLAALLLALLPGCLNLTWRRDTRFSAPPKAALATLKAGESTLAECLERLGAPLYVWEYKGDGAALAWGGVDADEKYWSLSLPLQDQISASMSWGDLGAKLRGVVLLFDRDWRLEMVREGWLRDLRRQIGRRRPAAEPDAG